MNKQLRSELSQHAKDTQADNELATALKAFGAVFQRTDRIITGTDINVAVVRDRSGYTQGAPGWTDGKTISLNQDVLGAKLQVHGVTDPDTILAIKGVNYHEVAHTLYSPRMKSALADRIRQDLGQDGWKALNILEDMRAESMFQAVYPTARHYFTLGVVQHCLDDPAKVAMNWPLITGRKFLPRKVRDFVLQEWEAKNGQRVPAAEFDRIVEQYKPLIFPQDEMQAYPLVREYMLLLAKAFGGAYNAPDALSSHDQGDPMPSKGRLGKRRQEAAQRSMDAMDYDDDEEDEEDDLYGSGFDGPSDDDDQDDADQEAEGLASGESGDADDDGEESGTGGQGDDGQSQAGNEAVESQDDAESGGSHGDGITESDSTDMDGPSFGEAMDALEELAEQIKDLDDIVDDIDSTQNAIKSELGDDYTVKGTRARHYVNPVQPAAEVMSRRLTSIWRELRIDLEPRWIHDQPHGRLNVKRAMTADFGDLDVFDLWDEGEEEAASTEVVLLLDQSISMGGVIDGASQIMWALKRGLDEAQIRTTVFGYSDGWTVLYLPEDTAERGSYRSFGAYGGTNPALALSETVKVLQTSSAKNRLMISITDGGWSLNDRVKSSMALLGKMGVYKVMFEYGRSWQVQDLGFDESHVIRDMGDLIPAVRDLVSEVMRNVRVSY